MSNGNGNCNCNDNCNNNCNNSRNSNCNDRCWHFSFERTMRQRDDLRKKSDDVTCIT